MNRRSLLGGLITALAAPAIIRTPGLLMPLSRLVIEDFTTDNLLIHATERHGEFWFLNIPTLLMPGVHTWVGRYPEIAAHRSQA